MSKTQKKIIIAISIILCTILLITSSGLSAKIHSKAEELRNIEEPIQWNDNPDIDTNENIWDAVNMLEEITPEELRAKAVECDPVKALKHPSVYFEQYIKFSGEVISVYQYPPKDSFGYKLNHGGPVALINIVPKGADFTIGYFYLGDTSGLKIGDTITVYGLVIGHMYMSEDPAESDAKALVAIGKAYDK